MKNRLILALLALLSATSLLAAEYGGGAAAYEDCYMVTSGQVTVRKAPDDSAPRLFAANGGDIIYVDDGQLYTDPSGNKWIKISGQEAYLPLLSVTRQANPNYVRPETPSLFESTPLWLLIILIVVFFSLAALFTWLAAAKWHWFQPLSGKGAMKRILFYNREPYLDCLLVVGIAFIAFLGTFLLFLLLGGIALGGGWLFRVLCFLVAYLLIIIGYMGGLAALGLAIWGDIDEIVVKVIIIVIGAALLWFGGIAMGWRAGILDFGQSAQSWGSDVLQTFNMADLGWALVKRYWRYALFLSLAPLALLSLCGIGFFIFSSVLIISERIMMHRYNVENPCPNCGRPSEPARYYSEGFPLDVPLMPGPYGIFGIVHPDTGEWMPTRFRDGKFLLERQCPYCHTMINAKLGEEKHIAFAGVSGSGKSSLMYRIMNTLLDRNIGGEPIAIRDDSGKSTDDKQFDRFRESIAGGKEMTNYPSQTTRGRHKALQLMLFNPRRNMSYRVFFNDLAGETFTAAHVKEQDASFLRNTEIVVFMLDPLSLRLKGLSLSPRMENWYRSQGVNPKESGIHVSVEESIDRLVNLIDHYKKGGTGAIRLIMNLGRADLGYLGSVQKGGSEALRHFVEDELGLANVTTRLENSFKSVEYVAVSAKDSVAKSGVNLFVDSLMSALDISYAKISGEQLRKCREDLEKQILEREEEQQKVRSGLRLGRKSPTTIASLAVLALSVLALVAWLWIGTNRRNGIRREALRQVESVMAGNSGSRFERAVNILDVAIGQLPSGSTQAKSLKELKEEIQKSYQIEVDAILSVLYANFSKQNGNSASNFEVSAKYRVMDNIKLVKEKLDELKALAPDNTEYDNYQKQFDAILTKYRIELK